MLSEKEDANNDEIDLFASEESESENEGRFKSSSSKNERASTVSTVSFSKLGTASASTVLDLNDVRSDKGSFGSSRRERGDDRYSRSSRKSNYSSRSGRDERFRSRNSSRNRSTTNYKGKSSSNSKSGADEGKTKKDEKSMFKSTFQIVENTTNKSGKCLRGFNVCNLAIKPQIQSFMFYRFDKIRCQQNEWRLVIDAAGKRKELVRKEKCDPIETDYPRFR